MPIELKLTAKQREQLQPLFDQVTTAWVATLNDAPDGKDLRGMVICQAHADGGLVCGFMPHQTAVPLRRALKKIYKEMEASKA